MPFTPPTLDECVERSRSDFEANLVGSNAWLFPNNVAVSAKVFGGLIWSAFRFLAWILRQILVSTCDPRYVQRHGAEFGMAPNAATPASGNVLVTMPVGWTFPNGGQFTRTDGVVLQCTADTVVPPGGVATVPVTTVLTGAMTNTIANMPLSTGVAGVTNVVVDSEGVLGGTDAESIEAFRKRVLYRKRNPPSVGNPTDYVRWAMSFPGVTRAFVTRAQFGPGTVGVQFMMDGTYANGVPLAGDAANLLAYLQGIAPSDAQISVIPPIAQPVPITIANLTPNTPTVQQAIIDELQGMFQTKGQFSPTMPLIFYRSWIDEAISRAAGEISHDLSTPSADVTVIAGGIPVVGTVTFA